jgi:hypothetical protein
MWQSLSIMLEINDLLYIEEVNLLTLKQNLIRLHVNETHYHNFEYQALLTFK